MMKHILTASAAVVALVALSAPSFADSTSTTITGTVTAACNISALAPATIAFGTIGVDSDGHINSGQTQTVDIGAAWCNGSSNAYSVTANPLATSGTAPTGFTNHVNYTLSSTLVSGSLDSASGTPLTGTWGAFTTTGAAGGGTVTLDTDPSTKPIAGDYSGTVDITVTPGV